jgi:hypothetical protein
MGYFDLMQNFLAIGILGATLLIVFAGMAPTDYLQQYDNNSFQTTGKINVELLDANATLQGTAYGITTSTDSQFLNTTFGNITNAQIPDIYALISNFPSMFVNLLTFIGIPQQIVWAVGLPILIFMSIGLLFFLLNAFGISRGGGL